MKVVIGAPVHQRGWVLPVYLRHLRAMRIPDGVEIAYCFIVNNSTDASEAILDRFRSQVPEEVRVIRMDRRALPADARDVAIRDRIYGWLAELRNRLFDEVVAMDADFLFSVDCDNLVPPHALTTLFAHQRRAVAAVVDNLPFLFYPEPYRYYNAMNRDPERVSPTGEPVWWHVKDLPVNGLVEVDMSGAVGLIAREVMEHCRYGYSQFGEDCALANQMLARGWRWAIDTRVRTRHIMRPEQLVRDDGVRPHDPGHIYHLLTPTQGGEFSEVEMSPALVERVMQEVWRDAFVKAAVQYYPLLRGMEVKDFHFDQERRVVVLRGPFHRPSGAGFQEPVEHRQRVPGGKRRASASRSR